MPEELTRLLAVEDALAEAIADLERLRLGLVLRIARIAK